MTLVLCHFDQENPVNSWFVSDGLSTIDSSGELRTSATPISAQSSIISYSNYSRNEQFTRKHVDFGNGLHCFFAGDSLQISKVLKWIDGAGLSESLKNANEIRTEVETQFNKGELRDNDFLFYRYFRGETVQVSIDCINGIEIPTSEPGCMEIALGSGASYIKNRKQQLDNPSLKIESGNALMQNLSRLLFAEIFDPVQSEFRFGGWYEIFVPDLQNGLRPMEYELTILANDHGPARAWRSVYLADLMVIFDTWSPDERLQVSAMPESSGRPFWLSSPPIQTLKYWSSRNEEITVNSNDMNDPEFSIAVGMIPHAGSRGFIGFSEKSSLLVSKGGVGYEIVAEII